MDFNMIIAIVVLKLELSPKGVILWGLQLCLSIFVVEKLNAENFSLRRTTEREWKTRLADPKMC